MPERRTSRQRPRILVAGLGNLLLKDDGVGVHAVRALHHGMPSGVRAVEVGTAVLDALHLIEWADRILAIDAMQADGPPGTVYRFGMTDVADQPITASLHVVDLLAAIRFLTCAHRPEVVVLGVQPETIETGMHLSPRVQAALPRIVAAAKDILACWRA
jgi:hydrogenase maturation protease